MFHSETGIRVLEIGCGAAGPTRRLAEHYPNSTFTATDISSSVLEAAREKCKGAHLLILIPKYLKCHNCMWYSSCTILVEVQCA